MHLPQYFKNDLNNLWRGVIRRQKEEWTARAKLVCYRVRKEPSHPIMRNDFFYFFLLGRWWRVFALTKSLFLRSTPFLLFSPLECSEVESTKTSSADSHNPSFKYACKRLILPAPSSLCVSLCSTTMESVHLEELTSGASGRIIPVFSNLRRSVLSWRSIRRSLIFIQSIFLWFILLLPRHRLSSTAQSPPSPVKSCRKRSVFRRDEEDTLRRRALAEGLEMATESRDGKGLCCGSTSLFYGTRRNALFCRSWFPVSGEIKYGLSNRFLFVVLFQTSFSLFDCWESNWNLTANLARWECLCPSLSPFPVSLRSMLKSMGILNSFLFMFPSLPK